MTSYTITVNGRSYDVTVQKKTAAGTSASTAKTIVPASLSGNSDNPMSAAKPSVPSGSEDEKVMAPMPGKIIEIKVRVGERVKKGQALLIMEAMKMHNPILAANEGSIGQLFVKVNEAVQSGQPLLTIRF